MSASERCFTASELERGSSTINSTQRTGSSACQDEVEGKTHDDKGEIILKAMALAKEETVLFRVIDSLYQKWYNIAMSDEPRLTVNFYKSTAGNEPVREWLLSMKNRNDRKVIGVDIKTVQFGWPMGMPLVKKLEDGLWEIRSGGLSIGKARIIFTVIEDRLILLHGIIKKTDKIPPEDMALARKRLSTLL